MNFITERINDSSPSELIFLCISSVLKKLLDNLAEIKSAIAAFDSAHDFLKSRDATRNHKRIPLLESELSVRFIEQHPEERMRQEARRNDEALPFVADVNREGTGGRGGRRGRRRRIVILRRLQSISEQRLVVRWWFGVGSGSDLDFLGEFLEGDHFLAEHFSDVKENEWKEEFAEEWARVLETKLGIHGDGKCSVWKRNLYKNGGRRVGEGNWTKKIIGLFDFDGYS